MHVASRLAAMRKSPHQEQPDASVTSDPDSDTNSVAPGQLGESSLPSKRSNTRSNKSKGPAYLKRKLERAIKHNMDAGIGPHEGEQLAKAEKFTGLKGDQALLAYKELIKQRVDEAEANKMTLEKKPQWFTHHLAIQNAPLSATVAIATEQAHLMRDTQKLSARQQDAWTSTAIYAKNMQTRPTLTPKRTETLLSSAPLFHGCAVASRAS